MSHIICNKRGISLVEAMIAVFITTVAVAAITAMQPLSLRTGASADYRGRAVNIAQAEASRREAFIMTTGTVLPADYNNLAYTVPGTTITYRITTVTTPPPIPSPINCQNCWLVSVKVTWPGTSNGVTFNRVVTQQMGY